MLNILASFLIAVVMSTSVSASIIAVIDSGTDMNHEQIRPNAWNNPIEIPNNDRDEDENGYQDDVLGWNFAEGNNLVIDYSYLGLLNEDIRRFFDIQARMIKGEATEEEINWLKGKVQDQEFIKKLSIYGNFMHGTHVAGIAIEGSENAKVLAVKIIPTEVKLPGQDKLSIVGGIKDRLIKMALKALAKQQMVLLEEVATYVNGHKADIANGSFGTGYAQSRMLIQTAAEALGLDLTEEEIKKYSIYFLEEIINYGKQMVASAPNTLFVFAAGNEGSNNDIYPSSPTNVKADNVISVAATVGFDRLASFSNFGVKMVDVAAPGVAINSSVPGDSYLPVSGTSQAAPFVSNIAGKIKDINEKLSPRDIKEVVIKTVDFREELKEKVLSGGVVNSTRAFRAAELSLEMSLGEALEMARLEVEDQETDKMNQLGQEVEFVLPLPSTLKF